MFLKIHVNSERRKCGICNKILMRDETIFVHTNRSGLSCFEHIECTQKEIEKERDATGKVFWDQGHNAEPLVPGRCCAECNNTKVIPERIKRMKEKGTW